MRVSFSVSLDFVYISTVFNSLINKSNDYVVIGGWKFSVDTRTLSFGKRYVLFLCEILLSCNFVFEVSFDVYINHNID